MFAIGPDNVILPETLYGQIQCAYVTNANASFTVRDAASGTPVAGLSGVPTFYDPGEGNYRGVAPASATAAPSDRQECHVEVRVAGVAGLIDRVKHAARYHSN
jgi:hypothetical protein